MKCVQTHRNKKVCNECFNKLPEKERGGRGMIEIGWHPSNAEKSACETCGDVCVDITDEALM